MPKEVTSIYLEAKPMPRSTPRSGLACIACRQRKVKCSGQYPSCESCLKRRLACDYRGHHPDGRRTDVESSSPINSSEEAVPTAYILDLSAKKFIELYNDFPFWFIRRHVFMEEARLQKTPIRLWYCILAVVARFISPLSEIHGSALEASQHFASKARRLQALGLEEVDLLNLQCILILTFHDMGQGDEHRVWLQLGIAARISQSLQLAYEETLTNYDPATAECMRRTFWTYFVLERLYVNGRDRPLTRTVGLPSVLLPKASSDFILGLSSIHGTSLLTGSETDSASGSLIRIVNILSKILNWGGAGIGGRHEDRRPPWSTEMPFSEFHTELLSWRRSLPLHQSLNKPNLEAHIAAGNGKVFAMMHLLYFQAMSRLHRKYLPFLPPLFYDPSQGPCDGPVLDSSADVPEFWTWSNRICIQSARKLSALYHLLLSSYGVLNEEPILGISLIASSTMHVFCVQSIWRSSAEYLGAAAVPFLRADVQALTQLEEHWSVATYWLKNIRLFYERLSISQDIRFITDPQKNAEVKARMLHIGRPRPDQEERDSSPLPEHDLSEFLRQSDADVPLTEQGVWEEIANTDTAATSPQLSEHTDNNTSLLLTLDQ